LTSAPVKYISYAKIFCKWINYKTRTLQKCIPVAKFTKPELLKNEFLYQKKKYIIPVNINSSLQKCIPVAKITKPELVKNIFR
jgi:hypothetical protein